MFANPCYADLGIGDYCFNEEAGQNPHSQGLLSLVGECNKEKFAEHRDKAQGESSGCRDSQGEGTTGSTELGPRELKRAPGELFVAEISLVWLCNYFRSLSNEYQTKSN